MKGTPVVSVIVPTHGRPQRIADCLDSLARQTLAPDTFEVIVVDDGSPLPVIVPSSLSAGGAAVALYRQANLGPAAARNRGIAEARGRYVAFIDDDCIAGPRWLATLVAALDAHAGAGAGGAVVNTLTENPYSDASQAIVSFICSYYNRDPGNARFFTSNNLAFPREGLVSAGAFSDEYQRAAAEDRELCDRWRAGGHRLVSVADAIVYHSHHLTLRTFWRQHQSYGAGARQFRAALAARQGDRIRVEPLRFYVGLLTAPVRQRGATGLVHAGLIVVAQIANAVGFWCEAARERLAPPVTSRGAMR